MQNKNIMIKGNKDGLNAIINMDKFGDFEEMLEALVERLSVGKHFYKGATLTITADLKHINERQMSKLKDVLFDEILIKDCIFADKEEKEEKFFQGVYEGRTKFLRKSIRSGQCVSYSGNIVIIGDVNHGAEVIALGNIIVFGSIKGRVFAGNNGNTRAIISAFLLQPEVLSIAGVMTITPDDFEIPNYPEVAKLKDGAIIVEPYLPNKYTYKK
ncbi:septum site-determining protein MinC [Clostridium mediterraneense]|uniref:septum site-determining protein MinC n=1 Tax=Clostridium mediterraneense TaxID=1805472 RepID=UPI00082E1CFC|nr:septum site-determining protein MinC [Clostridium mediterraneense]